MDQICGVHDQLAIRNVAEIARVGRENELFMLIKLQICCGFFITIKLQYLCVCVRVHVCVCVGNTPEFATSAPNPYLTKAEEAMLLTHITKMATNYESDLSVHPTERSQKCPYLKFG